MTIEETVTISKTDYDLLLFRSGQIDQINQAVNQLENNELDGFNFIQKVLGIL